MGERTSAARMDAPAIDGLPSQVLALGPRMREISTIIYRTGGATVRDIQQVIEDPITVYGIRTLLIRLTKRGIVKCRPSGKHTELLYLPAILTDRVKQDALDNFIDRHFDGSYFDALQVALRLVNSDRAVRSKGSGRRANPT